MLTTKLKLKLWWDKLILKKASKKTGKQVSSGGIMMPFLSILLKLLILLFFSAVVIFPFFLMVSTSLMTVEETRKPTLQITPDAPQWENFSKAMLEGYWGAVLITFSVTAASIIFKIFITMLMGYAFSLKNWKFKKTVWTGFLTLLMIPEVALLFGQYKIIVDLQLNFGPQIVISLVLPFIASVFSAFMFRNAFEAIPSRTKEAAFVDGTSHIKYFFKIAVPMVSPTMWTVVILTGFAAWNSYMWPSLLLSGSKTDVINTWLFKTGIEGFGDGRIQMNIRLAAAILAILPMFIVYFVFRSRIMKAISRQGSAIKG